MLLNKALMIAADAHDGQFYGKLPYITHPVDVWRRGCVIFKEYFDEEAQAIAVLHDTVEDTFVTYDYLRHWEMTEYIIEGVELVSKIPELSYKENIQRIIDSDHLGAIMTKYSDNRVNAHGDKSDMKPSRIKRLTEQYLMSMDMFEIYFEEKGIVI